MYYKIICIFYIHIYIYFFIHINKEICIFYFNLCCIFVSVVKALLFVVQQTSSIYWLDSTMHIL